MKRFFSLIALAAFSIASQMQNAHAWDMFAIGGHWNGHGAEDRVSVFCDQNEPSSDCAENPVPKNAAFLRKTFVSDEKFEPFLKWGASKFFQFEVRSGQVPVILKIPPDRSETFEKNAYPSRIGDDVKRLE